MARIIRNGNGWELLTLSKEQKAKLLENLRAENNELMKQCIRDAIDICATCNGKSWTQAVGDVANSLFDKLATKSYSRFAEAEVVKTFNEKESAQLVKAVAENGGSRI